MSGRARLTLAVQRYVPGVDAGPRWVEHPLPDTLSGSLLDGLAHIKAEQDPTLAYRWSCRMGMCGSCGVLVDDSPRLACEIFLRDLSGVVRVAPLSNFPVLRDLIVDADRFIAAIEAVRPWVEPTRGRALAASGESRVSPAENATFLDVSECVKCMLCYAACPQVALTPDFVGPAALALAHRMHLDPRDAGDRSDVVQAPDGVWACTVVGSCTAVCPKQVDPAAAIQRQKVDGLLAYARSWLPGSGG